MCMIFIMYLAHPGYANYRSKFEHDSLELVSQIFSFNLQFLIGAKNKQLSRFIKEDICNSFKLSSKLSNDVLISSVAIIRIFYH